MPGSVAGYLGSGGVTPDFGARVTYGSWEVASRVWGGGSPLPRSHTPGGLEQTSLERICPFTASGGQGEREGGQPDHRGGSWAAVQHQPPKSSYQHPKMAERRWAVIAGSAQEAVQSLQSVFTTCEPHGWCWLGGKW